MSQRFYESDENFVPTATPEKRLWCAVLVLATIDARSGNTENRTAIRHWIDPTSIHARDFIMVCELAGQDPNAVRAALLRLLAGTPKTRAPQRPKAASEEERQARMREYSRQYRQSKSVVNTNH